MTPSTAQPSSRSSASILANILASIFTKLLAKVLAGALTCGAMLAMLALPAAAQDASEPDTAEQAPTSQVYIVRLRQPAAIPALAALTGRGAKHRASRNGKFDADSAAVHSYAAGLTAEHDRLLASVGAEANKLYSYRLAFNGFAARLSAEQAAQLAADPAVLRVAPDRIRRLRSNASSSFMGLLDADEGLRQARKLRGENVVIGVIDSGITPEHPSFSDRMLKKKPRLCRSEWAESALLGRWLCKRFDKPRYAPAYAQLADWGGQCETGERFTTRNCSNKIVGARYYVEGFLEAYPAMDPGEIISPRDADGHGSHIASVAAGNAVQASIGGKEVGSISGVAPRARVAVYKACWLEPGAARGSCAMSDLQRAIEDAIADGVDIISYAIGTTEGSPLDEDAQALLNASDAGVLAVVAAGNSGPAEETIESPGSSPWVLAVAASSRSGARYDKVLRVTAPATAAGDFRTVEAGFTPPLRVGGAVTGRLVLVQATDDDALLTEGCAAPDNADEIDGAIALIIRGTCSFQAKVELAEAAGAKAVVIYDTLGQPLIMTGERDSVEIPAVAISRTDGDFLVARLAAGDEVQLTLDDALVVTRNETGNVLLRQSSRGPNPVTWDILKPDVVAPGTNILGAHSPDVANGVPGERYQHLSGTSMAVPQVAGVAALLKEAHPDWSPAALRSALVTTGRQNLVKNDGTTPVDAFDVGGGHVVPNAAIDPGLVYAAGRDDYDAWSCGAGIARVSAEDCAALVDAGYPTALDELNLPTLTSSALVTEHSVRRRVTNLGAAATYSAEIDAPAGIGIAVEPATLTLATGETAELTVTFTNLGETDLLEQWGFGALTWSDGSHEVRSPLAVRIAPFAAPAAVSGAGATGATAFDVGFGYEGTYNVSAEGLVAPSVLGGNVLDDPLDLYAPLPAETTPPDHVRRFAIAIPEGTTYLRVSLSGTDEGSSDDLDLYLLCPDLEPCVGEDFGLASNSAGAEEVIDVLEPAAGQYFVDVHGFQTDEVTGGPGANFALRVWQVGSDEALGNLQVTAASVASPGETTEVAASWEDLPAGESYLGLIRHDDGESELGQTLLEVVVAP